MHPGAPVAVVTAHRALQMLATTRPASPTLSNQVSHALPSDAHALAVRHAERSPLRPSPALQLAHRHALPGLAGRPGYRGGRHLCGWEEYMVCHLDPRNVVFSAETLLLSSLLLSASASARTSTW